MLIRSLNQSFQKHRRLYFGIFAALIIIAFTPGLFSIVNGTAGSGEVGTVYGRSVTYKQLAPLRGQLRVLRLLQAVPDESEETLFIYYAQLQDLKRAGIEISDSELANFIIKTKIFNGEGDKFDADKYQQFLSGMTANGLPKSEVENALRTIAGVQKLNEKLTADVKASDEEALELFRQQQALRKVRIAEFPARKPEPEKLTDADLKAYYDAHSERFIRPGYLKAALIETADPQAALTSMPVCAR